MRILLLTFALLLSCVSLEGAPAQIFIIRHAEKPKEGHSLDLKGRERAAALAPFFKEDPIVTHFGPPTAIFAAQPTHEDGSTRPVETAQPIAHALKIPLNTEYHHKEYEKLAHALLHHPSYAGKVVLIVWEHGVIPMMAEALGVKDAPKEWPGHVFDRVWTITYGKEGSIHFADVPQKLMYGDSDK